MILKKILKLIYHCFALLGMTSVIFGFIYVGKLMNDHNLSPRQFVVKAAKKMGINSEVVQTAIAPGKRFETYRLTGNLKPDHPRLIFKSRDEIEKLRDRYFSDPGYGKMVDTYTNGASRWLCAMDFKQGKEAIARLLNAELTLPNAEGNYGNGFDIALAYDFLYFHPEWTLDKRNIIHSTLKTSIKQALMVLDENSASMWHGRFQLACSNWVVACAFDPFTDEDMRLLARSQAYFLEAIKAISITGGWPEGYNYWINNRAYSFAVACLAHLNSIDDEQTNNQVRQAIETAGLWMIYGTRPDGLFHLFGDSGPRNDLKDETQRVVDLICLATRNPVFSKFSGYIKHLHGSEGYYREYRWGLPLFQGLSKYDTNALPEVSDLSFADGYLKPSAIFGKGNFNQVFIRSGWKNDDTFIAFRAGDTFTHHGHYKAGHFTLFKRSALALSSGAYGDYTSEHRLNYYIRTISSNSILIVDPDNCQKPNSFFKDCIAGGGQRIIIPTGSAITSVEDFQKNYDGGKHFQGGKILIFDNSHPDYVYVKSDLTNAYSDEQANSVMRELVYLVESDVLIIHDIVESHKAEFTKKWLLHSWGKPMTADERVVTGNNVNGIMETHDKKAEIVHEKGKLNINVIFPENCLIRKIGGPDYRYYVETDGDDRVLNGRNMINGVKEKPWFDSGMWRIELQSEKKEKQTEFLVILQPLDAEAKTQLQYHVRPDVNGTKVTIGKITAMFSKNKDDSVLFSF